MDYNKNMVYKDSSNEAAKEQFPEIKFSDLLHKYGPEGLYDIADLLRITADEDVSDAASFFIGMEDDETDETGAP